MPLAARHGNTVRAARQAAPTQSPEQFLHGVALIENLDRATVEIADVLADPEPWAERGLARAAAFSWGETARATDAVYGELL